MQVGVVNEKVNSGSNSKLLRKLRIQDNLAQTRLKRPLSLLLPFLHRPWSLKPEILKSGHSNPGPTSHNVSARPPGRSHRYLCCSLPKIPQYSSQCRNFYHISWFLRIRSVYVTSTIWRYWWPDHPLQPGFTWRAMPWKTFSHGSDVGQGTQSSLPPPFHLLLRPLRVLLQWTYDPSWLFSLSGPSAIPIWNARVDTSSRISRWLFQYSHLRDAQRRFFTVGLSRYITHEEIYPWPQAIFAGAKSISHEQDFVQRQVVAAGEWPFSWSNKVSPWDLDGLEYC